MNLDAKHIDQILEPVGGAWKDFGGRLKEIVEKHHTGGICCWDVSS